MKIHSSGFEIKPEVHPPIIGDNLTMERSKEDHFSNGPESGNDGKNLIQNDYISGFVHIFTKIL